MARGERERPFSFLPLGSSLWREPGPSFGVVSASSQTALPTPTEASFVRVSPPFGDEENGKGQRVRKSRRPLSSRGERGRFYSPMSVGGVLMIG